MCWGFFFKYSYQGCWSQNVAPPGLFLSFWVWHKSHNSIVLEEIMVSCLWFLQLQRNGATKGLGCVVWTGKFISPTYVPMPEPLSTLLDRESSEAKRFCKQYSAFQMTSFAANEEDVGGFMHSFKIHGQIYHKVGSVLPACMVKITDSYKSISWVMQTAVSIEHVFLCDYQQVSRAVD